MRKVFGCFLAALISASLLIVFDYFAPLEPASVCFYAGIVLAGAGALMIAVPGWFCASSGRTAGLLIAAAGLAVAAGGLSWPARRITTPVNRTQLDEILPEYHFSERHATRVHASPETVLAALGEVTFGEVPAFDVLGRIRGLAFGRFSGADASLGGRRILEQMQSPRSMFFRLSQTDRELVMGLLGRPWANQAAPKAADLAAFRSFDAPCSVKVAFNLRIEDEGGGWSRISTETRVLATDDAATRTMARYWRVIYPGSGIIRRMWLNAVRRRAEAGPPRSGA